MMPVVRERPWNRFVREQARSETDIPTVDPRRAAMPAYWTAVERAASGQPQDRAELEATTAAAGLTLDQLAADVSTAKMFITDIGRGGLAAERAAAVARVRAAQAELVRGLPEVAALRAKADELERRLRADRDRAAAQRDAIGSRVSTAWNLYRDMRARGCPQLEGDQATDPGPERF